MHSMTVGGVRVLGSVDAIEKIYRSTPFNEIVIVGRQLDQRQLLLLRQFAHWHDLRLCTYSAQLEELFDNGAMEGYERTAAMQPGRG